MMIRRTYKLLLGLSLLLTGSVPFPGHQASDCKERVRSLYEDLEERFHASLEASEGVRMSYTMTTHYEESVRGKEKARMRVRFWGAEGRARVETPIMEVFRDRHRVVVVLDRDEQVRLLTDPTGKGEPMGIGSLSPFRDSLLEHGEVVECERLPSHPSGADQRVRVAFDEQVEREKGVVELVLLIDQGAERIRRIDIKHSDLPGVKRSMAAIDRRVFRFEELRFGLEEVPVHENVLRHVFNEKGELLPEYRGYELIDQRKKDGRRAP